MQQIADWLKQLGMPEYIQPFAENDIDFAILRVRQGRHAARRWQHVANQLDTFAR